jgi:hypothetical protein
MDKVEALAEKIICPRRPAAPGVYAPIVIGGMRLCELM